MPALRQLKIVAQYCTLVLVCMSCAQQHVKCSQATSKAGAMLIESAAVQTGAGKTFSMSGDVQNYAHRGIIPRALHHIFK
jgi:hypothetical protein